MPTLHTEICTQDDDNMTSEDPYVEHGTDISKQPINRGRAAGEGVALGALCGMLVFELGIGILIKCEDILILPALLGLIIGLSRARIFLRIVAGILLTAALVVGYTPLINPLIRGLSRTDPLQPCPAIVILSSNTYKDGVLSAHANDRAMHAYMLLRKGYAHELVMDDGTVRYPSQIPGVKQQMEMLGLQYPIETAGPAANTHDEALVVARLARRNGWKQLILVTQSWHMRRAAAVFEKAGVSVLCSPSEESEYDLSRLDTPDGRLRAFRDWLHEIVGYQVYRRQGWID